MFRIQKVIYHICLFLGIILLAVCLHIFLFEIYTISSSSMANTLRPGDKILVSKLNYGAKLPRSPFEIPWLNVVFSLNKKARAKADTTWWKYKRLSGFSKINRGDIIVFQFPDNNNKTFIKRCIALPGDTFQIIDSDVFIKNRLQSPPVESKKVYRVWYNSISSFSIITDSLNIPVYDWWTTKQDCFREIKLTRRQKKQLSGLAGIDSLTSGIKTDDFTTQYYPWHERYSWTLDNMGPFIIPGKELKIMPDENDVILYKKILKMFEHAGIINNSGEWKINDTLISNYGFNQDYYFMLGDNRDASNDSRYWGFVPEDHIIGKACFVLFSLNPDKKGIRKIRWNRMFMKIK